MKLEISDSLVHESINSIIEQLYEEHESLESKKQFVESLNKNIKRNKYTWQQCTINNDLSITVEYPHYIKRNKNNQILKFRYKDGYIIVSDKAYLHHQIIAKQFIPNLKNYIIVDHINHNKIDNRIENLRWVSHGENCQNRSSTRSRSYEFIDELPNDSIEIRKYKTFEFQNYFISLNEQNIYFHTGVNYRLLPVRRKNNVNMRDINGNNHEISIKALMKNLSNQ